MRARGLGWNGRRSVLSRQSVEPDWRRLRNRHQAHSGRVSKFLPCGKLRRRPTVRFLTLPAWAWGAAFRPPWNLFRIDETDILSMGTGFRVMWRCLRKHGDGSFELRGAPDECRNGASIPGVGRNDFPVLVVMVLLCSRGFRRSTVAQLYLIPSRPTPMPWQESPAQSLSSPWGVYDLRGWNSCEVSNFLF